MKTEQPCCNFVCVATGVWEAVYKCTKCGYRISVRTENDLPVRTCPKHTGQY